MLLNQSYAGKNLRRQTREDLDLVDIISDMHITRPLFRNVPLGNTSLH